MGLLKHNIFTLSKYVSFEGMMVTSGYNRSLEDELQNSFFSMQCKELTTLGENESAFNQTRNVVNIPTCGRNFPNLTVVVFAFCLMLSVYLA